MTTVYTVHSIARRKKLPYCQCSNITTYGSRRTAKDKVNIYKDEILQKIFPSFGLRFLCDRHEREHQTCRICLIFSISWQRRSDNESCILLSPGERSASAALPPALYLFDSVHLRSPSYHLSAVFINRPLQLSALR